MGFDGTKAVLFAVFGFCFINPEDSSSFDRICRAIFGIVNFCRLGYSRFRIITLFELTGGRHNYQQQ